MEQGVCAQAENVVESLFEQEDSRGLVDHMGTVTESVERISLVTAELPAVLEREREAVMATFQAEREIFLTALLLALAGGVFLTTLWKHLPGR